MVCKRCILILIIVSVLLVLRARHLRIPVNFKKRYQCRYAVVTGATGGIGIKLVQRLLKQVNVIALGRNQEILYQLQQMNSNGNVCLAMNFDFSENLDKFGDEFDTFLSQNRVNKEQIGAVFSNIGYSDYKWFHEIAFEEKQKYFNANIQSHVLMADYFVQLFLKRNSQLKCKSAVIFTASAESYIVGHKISCYHISKRAVHALGSALFAEYSRKGIDVNVVHPAAVTGKVLKQFAQKVGNKSEFRAVAVTEDEVVDQLTSRVGKQLHSDCGWATHVVDVAQRVLGDNVLAWVHAVVGGQ